MRVSRLWFTIVLLCSASASLQAQRPVPTYDFVDSQWQLQSFGGANTEIPPVKGTTITLEFGSTGRAGGSTGCNSYSGTYTVRGNDTISFGRIISTKRACLNPRANQQEQRYLRALGSARTYRADGTTLTINAGSNGTLNFVRQPQAIQPAPGYEDIKSPVGLLASFYNAINTREYDRAYRYWENPPASLEEFARGYRDTVKVQLIVEPPMKIDGAAGNSQAEIPTLIIARLQNGTERIYSGCYVMTESNQGNLEDGAWRISRASLSPVATATSILRLLTQACRK